MDAIPLAETPYLPVRVRAHDPEFRVWDLCLNPREDFIRAVLGGIRIRPVVHDPGEDDTVRAVPILPQREVLAVDPIGNRDNAAPWREAPERCLVDGRVRDNDSKPFGERSLPSSNLLRLQRECQFRPPPSLTSRPLCVQSRQAIMKVNGHRYRGSLVEVLRHHQTVHVDEIRPPGFFAEGIPKSSVIFRVPVQGGEVTGQAKPMMLLASPRGRRRIR